MLRVRDLKVYFPVRKGLLSRVVGYIKAVDGVSIDISRGEILGLVGESGSGKTTFSRAILMLVRPTSGMIEFEGVNIFRLKGRKLKEFRRKVQAVFQNPFLSLNPRLSVMDIVSEPLKTHFRMTREEIVDSVVKHLELVGLGEDFLNKYPHELSGGQAQRVAIARALTLNPLFLVLDEPTSALDVSVQAQILNLLKDLKEKLNLTYLFISHDLSVVYHLSTRVAVMYLGKIAEVGSVDEVFTRPAHPYTEALMSAIPGSGYKHVRIKGEPPSPINPPRGCRFSTRCPYVMEKCRTTEPKLVEVKKGHAVSCYLYQE